MEVNDREQCFIAVKQENEYFGSIDVLINNAGYGLFGAIEETTEQEARDQIETITDQWLTDRWGYCSTVKDVSRLP